MSEKSFFDVKVGENFLVPLKGGRRVECTKVSDNSFSFELPAGSTRRRCDPVAGRCDFGQDLDKCEEEPWNCPSRVESFLREQGKIEEKIFNISPGQRDLSFLKSRLAHRCATNHSKRGNPKPLTENEARAVSRLKLRQQKKPEMARDARRKVRAIVMADKEREAKKRTEQIKREVQERKPEPPIKPEEGSEREATIGGGLFERVEDNEPRFQSVNDAMLVHNMRKRRG